MKNTKRVQYNFLLEFPLTFTMQELMAKYPKISYITLYMRVQKAIRDKIIKETGTVAKAKTRGRSQKVYGATQNALAAAFPKRSHKKKVAAIVGAMVSEALRTPTMADATEFVA